MRRLLVKALESGCVWTHWFQHRPRWLWWGLWGNGYCTMATWSDALDQRWQTEMWWENGSEEGVGHELPNH